MEHPAESREVGVGPHPEPWPDDPRLDPELLRDGDRRNVLDRYRYWSRDAIVADLDQRRHTYHVAIENWQHDFNIGAIVRNANAFLAAAVHIIGKRRWNRRRCYSMVKRGCWSPRRTTFAPSTSTAESSKTSPVTTASSSETACPPSFRRSSRPKTWPSTLVVQARTLKRKGRGIRQWTDPTAAGLIPSGAAFA